MLEYIPYFIANIFQSGAYAICMLYLTGELSQQKKHPVVNVYQFFSDVLAYHHHSIT